MASRCEDASVKSSLCHRETIVNQPAEPTSIRIFLIDDYRTVLWGLAKLIRSEYPHMKLVGTASNLSDAMAGVIQQAPDVVLLDHDLNDDDILHFLPQLVAQGNYRILILTGLDSSADFSRRLVELGACGTINKNAPAALILQAIECAFLQGNWPGKLSLR